MLAPIRIKNQETVDPRVWKSFWEGWSGVWVSIIGVGPVLRPTTQRCKKRAQLQGRHLCTLTIRGCALVCVAPGAIQPGFGEYLVVP